MKKLPSKKFRKALELNEFLAEKSPTIDFSNQSIFGQNLTRQLQEWPEGTVRGDDNRCKCELCVLMANLEPEFDEDGCVNLISFQETSKGSGKWRSLLIPKDLLGMSCVVYKATRIEVWRHWTKDSPRELVAVFDWDDPQLLDKVLIAATEDISADWGTLV